MIGYLSPIDYERQLLADHDPRLPAPVLATVKGKPLRAAPMGRPSLRATVHPHALGPLCHFLGNGRVSGSLGLRGAASGLWECVSDTYCLAAYRFERLSTWLVRILVSVRTGPSRVRFGPAFGASLGLPLLPFNPEHFLQLGVHRRAVYSRDGHMSQLSMRTRASISVDLRTQTEYGTLRSYLETRCSDIARKTGSRDGAWMIRSAGNSMPGAVGSFSLVTALLPGAQRFQDNAPLEGCRRMIPDASCPGLSGHLRLNGVAEGKTRRGIRIEP